MHLPRPTQGVWSGLLLLAIGYLHVHLCPYTKVEESFNIQAIHDILVLDNLSDYDHHEYPGVVPRTFVGALTVASVTLPLKTLWVDLLGGSLKAIQTLARMVLLSFGLAAFLTFAQAVGRTFGKDTRIFLIAITAVQFHLMFYMSRTLPNTFALVLVLYAYSCWFEAQYDRFLIIFTFTTIIFRADTVLIFAPLVLLLLLTRQITWGRTVGLGLVSSVAALLLTVLVDSYFWNTWVWPEGQVLWFNTVENQSAAWGVSPFHWYWTSALPRAMLLTGVLVPFGLCASASASVTSKRRFWAWDTRAMKIFLPTLLYIMLFSFLPHKELRFIFNALPLFNTLAALGAAKLDRHRHTTRVPIRWLLLSILGSTAVGTLVCLTASRHNYPGGYALAHLHAVVPWNHTISSMSWDVENTSETRRIHIDVPAAMTGVTRFGQASRQWSYDKREHLSTDAEFQSFHYLLTSDPAHPSKKHFHALGPPFMVFARLSLTSWMGVATVPHTYLMRHNRLTPLPPHPSSRDVFSAD